MSKEKKLQKIEKKHHEKFKGDFLLFLAEAKDKNIELGDALNGALNLIVVNTAFVLHGMTKSDIKYNLEKVTENIKDSTIEVVNMFIENNGARCVCGEIHDQPDEDSDEDSNDVEMEDVFSINFDSKNLGDFQEKIKLVLSELAKDMKEHADNKKKDKKNVH